METELIIKLKLEDCKEIFEDLKKLFREKIGLNPKTYLLYNKIKFFNVPYLEEEEKKQNVFK